MSPLILATKELLKRIGGYYLDLSFGKRPQRELYRLADDSWRLRNLATDPYYAPIAAELDARMLQMLREDNDPRALGDGHIFDTYPDIGKRDKGYETWLKAQDPALEK